MPARAHHPCPHPGCGAVVQHGRCPTHARERKRELRQRDAKRGTATQRGYGASWRAIRAEVIVRDPICRICHRNPSTDADHVVPRSRGGTDDLTNLQGTCHGCHSSKTAREDDGFGNARRRA
jgi:5-methylcytosine-specific restriction protein A